jgi:hypothetical protein
MFEQTGIGDRARGVDLREWAALPLHRLVVSAGLQPGGTLVPVGHLATKARSAAQEPGVVALAAVNEQVSQVPWRDGTPGRPSVIGASSLPELMDRLAGRLGAAAYGPVVELPDVLRYAGSERAGPWPRAYDYRADSYRALRWLDERVLQALLAPAAPSGDAGDPPLGQLRKHADRGYVHILGSASSGKTSWALNWVRQSTGEVPSGPLPKLAGWYFARRQGQGAYEHGSELHALQNLISLARRQHDLLPRAPGPHDPEGTPLNLLSRDERDAFHAQPDGNQLQLLSRRFMLALKTLAEDRQPTAEQPMVFLIDGGDEMWGPGTRFQRWSFPQVLPTLAELPPHVYVVLLSRPGPHMLGFAGKEPVLRYAFTPEDVNRSIEQFLLDLALHWERRHPGSEAAALLRRSELAQNICRASEGAFGYVVLLLRHWLPQQGEGRLADAAEHDLRTLRRWREQPDALPEGIYGMRAEEFIALLEPGAPSVHQPGQHVSLAEALALIGQLRWPLSRHQLLELLYPGDTLYGHASPLREQLRAQLQRGSISTVMTCSTDSPSACPRHRTFSAWMKAEASPVTRSPDCNGSAAIPRLQ